MSVGFRNRRLRPRPWMHVGVFVAIAATLVAVMGWWLWIHWAPSSDNFPLQGISVSARQGDIDWGSVRAAGVDFVYIRATQGAKMRDPDFAANWSGAREVGLRYGAELFYDPCRAAAEQATLFITTVPRDNAALPPAIRLEMASHCAPPNRDKVMSELNMLINLVERHSGKQALLHVPKSFERAYNVSSDIHRTLWLDRNFFRPGYVDKGWVMWMASNSRRIDGVSGPVEWDVVAP